ncbi:MAG: CDP-alcohol phosphatidyltransferase family protein [Spirochaetaceae bacterium]
MFDPMLRPVKERVIRPLAELMGRYVSPLALTLAGAALGLAAAGAVLVDLMWLAFSLWLVGRIFDGLDGVVARVTSRRSDLGGYLDMLLDTIVYAAVPVAMALRPLVAPGAEPGVAPSAWFPVLPAAAWPALATVALLAVFYVNIVSWTILSSIIEKLRARAPGEAAPERYTTVAMPSGLIEGTETILFFSLFLALPRWYVPLAALMAALTLIGVAQRVVWARRNLTPGPPA